MSHKSENATQTNKQTLSYRQRIDGVSRAIRRFVGDEQFFLNPEHTAMKTTLVAFCAILLSSSMVFAAPAASPVTVTVNAESLRTVPDATLAELSKAVVAIALASEFPANVEAATIVHHEVYQRARERANSTKGAK